MFSNLWSRFGYFLTDFWLYLILILLSAIILAFAFYKTLKSKLSLKNQRIVLSLAFTIFIIIITFSALEAYFRYVYDVSDGLGFLKVNGKWHQRHVIYNNYAFRDRDFEIAKKEGVIRIGVLGDSITVGGGIENINNRFTNILEKKLVDAGHKVEVYNFGKLGYDTEEEIGEYQKIKHLDPDIIVWQYFLNDIQPYGKSTGTPIISVASQQGKIAKILSQHSFFFDFLYWRFSQRYSQTFEALKNADLAQYQNGQIFQKHQNEIATFIQDLKAKDKKIIVIIFPFIHLIGPNYPALAIHEKMRSVFTRSGANVVIDLLEDLDNLDPKTLIASRFDPHPNEFVHRLAAEKLFNEILPLLSTWSPSVR